MTDSQNLTELIRRGQAAARVGHRDEAREYLRHAVQLDPANIVAWLDLAGVEDDPAEKVACFEAVLTQEPDNAEAKLGLQMLQGDADTDLPQDPVSENELETIIAEASRQLDKAVGPPPPNEVPADDGVLYCANHPNVETMLRCNRCGKPICTRCAVQTPVGYRCKQCVGQQQAIFYTGSTVDYIVGAMIALVLGGIASALIASIGGWFFGLILGAPIGIGIAEVVRFALRRRRSRYLWLVVAVSIVASALPTLLARLVGFVAFSSTASQGSPLLGAAVALQPLLTIALYLVLAVGAAIARLR
jgi:hypothetical protein